MLAFAICWMNKITSKIKKEILARKDAVLMTDNSNNIDIHSIKTTSTARLKILVRYLLSASAESRKINVKKSVYKMRCHSIGKKGIKNIVKITSSKRAELLVVKNLLDTFDKNDISIQTFFDRIHKDN